jgi:SAM-dependent methyltransferase
LIEFTGERVVPDHVDIDLWNEHLARYAFAARLVAGKRVLDAGCGSGYGSAELAATARSVIGLDVSPDAVGFATQFYRSPNLSFVEGSCASLPIAPQSIDLVVAFEVIEHIADWQAFLQEVQRVLAPGGRLVLSTPNKEYYATTRRNTGPNPYHVHEFDFAEFESELRVRFPHVALYLENHVEAIAFHQADSPADGTPDLRQVRGAADPATAHFFLAVCSADSQFPPAFLYVPSAANVLRERELHIDKLEIDLHRLRAEKQRLVEMFRAQTAELEKSNGWAHDLDQQLAAAQARIVQLQHELAEMSAGYEAKIAELEAENLSKSEWGRRLDGEINYLQGQLNLVRASRWVKVGNRLGVGPAIDPLSQ